MIAGLYRSNTWVTPSSSAYCSPHQSEGWVLFSVETWVTIRHTANNELRWSLLVKLQFIIHGHVGYILRSRLYSHFLRFQLQLNSLYEIAQNHELIPSMIPFNFYSFARCQYPFSVYSSKLKLAALDPSNRCGRLLKTFPLFRACLTLVSFDKHKSTTERSHTSLTCNVSIHYISILV